MYSIVKQKIGQGDYIIMKITDLEMHRKKKSIPRSSRTHNQQ